MQSLEGRVGLFFVVDGRIILYACPLERAARYGDYLDYPHSHDAMWRKLQQTKYGVDFDSYPRGRVVFSVPENRYVISHDRCCAVAARLLVRSYAPGRADSRTDEHYQCHSCNPRYVR